jgi:isopentenyldiphosphate isomerase
MKNKMDKKYQANKPDEMLDWVDENDEVIGEIIRHKANAEPKYIHREVGILLADDQKRILLQKRSKLKTVKPSFWSIGCAGHVTKGENPDLVAHQELKEELGFDTELTFIGKRLRRLEKETHFMYYYLGFYEGQDFILEPTEVDSIKFFFKR